MCCLNDYKYLLVHNYGVILPSIIVSLGCLDLVKCYVSFFSMKWYIMIACILYFVSISLIHVKHLHRRFKGISCVFKKKIMNENYPLPNKTRSHLVIIVLMAPFTLKSTSKLRSALHFKYSIVVPRFISLANTAQS